MLTKIKNKYIDTAFFRYVLVLAVPMIIQNAITSFVSFLDNIMVGQVGTEQMSGVAIVNQLIFVFNICIWGGVSGAGIFGTQFYGKGDYEGQKYAFRFKMYACIIIAGIALLLFGFFDTDLISLYLSDGGSVGNTALALQYGEQYLRIMMAGLVPFAVSQAYVNTIRETGHTFVPMLASLAAVVTNLVLDYVLIFGIGGIPAYGVQGAAIATVAARFVECAIVVIWAHTHIEKNPYLKGVYHGFSVPGHILSGIIKKGTPLMFNEMLWAVGMAVIAQCYAVRGLEVVAAQNISSTISNLFNIVYLQLGGCIGVSLIMIFAGRYFPMIYKTEDSIKELAGRFIMISALVMPLCAFSHASYFTLRSGGKTGITFLFDSVYTWVIVIPLATILAKHTALTIEMVFFFVSFTEIIKVTIGYFMIRSGIWLQNIVKEP